jgi:inner membrane protein
MLNDILSNPALIWFLVGLAFLLLELVLPGLIVFFFGAGAWVTSLVVLIFPEVGVNPQLAIFLFISIVSLVFLRKNLKNRFFKDEHNPASLEDEFIGKPALADTNFKNGKGKVIFKGAPWGASSDEPVIKGQDVEIIGKESINLIVKPKK